MEYNLKRSGILNKTEKKLNISKRTLYRHLKNGTSLDTIKQELAEFNNDKLLTFKEVASILNCSKSSVYRWTTEEGKIPYYAIFGTALRVKASDLNKIIEESYINLGTD